jgi:hypothetical protein
MPCAGREWYGPGANATIERNAFLSNGDAATRSMWSDGLTLLSAPRSTIRENTFEDNSDVALIIGYGVDSRLEHNAIRQRTQPAFAGLMLPQLQFQRSRLEWRLPRRGDRQQQHRLRRSALHLRHSGRPTSVGFNHEHRWRRAA